MKGVEKIEIIQEKLNELKDYAVDLNMDSFRFITTGLSFFYSLAYSHSPNYEEVEKTVDTLRNEIKKYLDEEK